MPIRSPPGALRHIGIIIVGLLSAAVILPAAEAAPVPDQAIAIFRQENVTPERYLTMDASHAVLQDGDGVTSWWSTRVVRQADGTLAAYQWGEATDMRLSQVKDALQVRLRDGTVERFRRVATAPSPIGWQPYPMPVAAVDAATRAKVAERLHLSMVECQRLEKACDDALGDPAVAREPEKSPEYQAYRLRSSATLAWLRETIQTTGWITSGSGPHVVDDLTALARMAPADLRLMATLRAGVLAELAHGTFPERGAAAIIDACAAAMGDPLPYGSLVQYRMIAAQPGVVEQVIPVPADVTEVESARHRAGLPRLGQFAAAEGATIVRIDDDGRQVGEVMPMQQAPAAVEIDVVALDQAARDPQRVLRELGTRDPAFAKAFAEAGQGRIAALATWVGGAGIADRMLFQLAAQQLSRQGNPADLAQACFAQRNLYAAYLAGAPASLQEDAPRISVSRDLALGLAGRAAAPTAAELGQAVGLAAALERGLQRPDLRANPPIAHPMADALACIYYRQGRMAEAAATWKEAIALAGSAVPETYRRRLQASESGGKADALPR